VSPDCIFCRIVAREIPSKAAYEDDEVYGFHDIHPQAPVHVLFVPKRHIATVNDIPPGDLVAGKLALAASKTAAEIGIASSGYRLVMNCNADGGQEVFHLHLHLMGGRPLKGGMG
jgi:histidine triad (HIT) family protein